MFFSFLVIVYTDDNDVALIFIETQRVILFQHLVECCLDILIVFQFKKECWLGRIDWDEYHNCKSLARRQFSVKTISALQRKIGQCQYTAQAILIVELNGGTIFQMGLLNFLSYVVFIAFHCLLQ